MSSIIETKTAESGVYLIRNLWTGRLYIGSSHDIQDRWRTHITRLNARKHPNPKLQAAWIKYGGEASFEFRIIEYVPATRDALVAREQHWMNTYQVWIYGYNLRPRAESCLGFKRGPATLEHRLKNSQAKTGPGNPNYGKPRSEETKAKISAAQTGKPRGPHTEVTRILMSEAQAARYAGGVTDEHREQLRKAQRSRVYKPHSEATKQRMREAWARRKSGGAIV